MTPDKSASDARELEKLAGMDLLALAAGLEDNLCHRYCACPRDDGRKDCIQERAASVLRAVASWNTRAPQGGEREAACPSPAVSDDQIAYAKELATERREAWSVSAVTVEELAEWICTRVDMDAPTAWDLSCDLLRKFALTDKRPPSNQEDGK